MDSLIIEQAQDMIKRLDDTLQNGTFDRQTGKDIDMAKVHIHELIGWLKLVELERDDLDKSVIRLAKENHILKSKLDKPVEDDTLTVTRFD
jgi:hypothetical protein